MSNFDNKYTQSENNKNIRNIFRNDNNNKLFSKFMNLKNKDILSEKNCPVNDVTSERERIDEFKDSSNNDNNDTSVDIKSGYCEEKINIKASYNFNSHESFLKVLVNNRITPDIPKEEKTPNEPNTKEYVSMDSKEINFSKKNNINDNEYTPMGENSNRNIDNISPIKASVPINKNIDIDTYNYDMYSSFDNNNIDYKAIYFKEIMMFKNIEFDKSYESYYTNEIFTTDIIYKKKECILLIRKEFLYVLNKKPRLKEEEIKKPKRNENNPDISLINQLQLDDSLKDIDKNNLKYNYDISYPLICLNFNLLSCKLLLNKKNNDKNAKIFEVQILILGTSSKFRFFFKNFEIYKKFSYIIGSKINTLEGNKANKLGLSLRTKNFYKDTYIRTQDFESIAKTGDLLLFRTLDCLSDCQRFFTRDKYDHIVLILKRSGVIELLETTSTDNCNLLEWNRFKIRLYNLIFKKIVLRKLNIEEKDPNKLKEIQENIERKTNEFYEKIQKKQYIMSILKMIIDRKPKEYEISGEWEKAKGYCCSALTAAYYIYIGVMKLEKSVHCIKPGDFEQDRNRVTFLPGFSLGPEIIIEFST